MVGGFLIINLVLLLKISILASNFDLLVRRIDGQRDSND